MTIFNFSAGPAVIAQEVIDRHKKDLSDWQQTGASILSTSHRSKAFYALADELKQRLRDLMNIPDDYEILLLHGGATMQAVMIAMNFLGEGKFGNYVNTGIWGTKAFKEAQHIGDVREIARGVESAMDLNWPIEAGAEYVHFVPNETAEGIEFTGLPDTDVPLIADLSSTILSRPIDVAKYAMIYAGAQKNIGPAGVAVVIIKRDFLEKANENIPPMMQYKAHAKANSIYNTVATASWNLINEVFKWIQDDIGGLDAMAKHNEAKAALLYQAIDDSQLFENRIPTEVRSWMNVTAHLKDDALTQPFIEQAAQRGLINISGYKTVGGLRISLYNAMSIEGVEAMVDFMREFEKANS